MNRVNSMPIVSVIIPTYNRRSFLEKALFSVLAQTFAPLEVIVVDDGSDDGTLDWLHSLQEPASHVIQTSNRGPAVARNRGVAAAQGKWIAFLDSDDQWLPQKLKFQIQWMEQNPKYRFCQTDEIWIRNGLRVNPKKRHRKPSGWVFEECLELCRISPSAVCIEKKFFEELGGFDEGFIVCEDYELWLRASLKSPFATLEFPAVLKYGGHADQLSKKFPAMDQFRVKAMEKILNTENLSTIQRTATLDELRRKLLILSQGYAKRYPHQPNPYIEKLQQWNLNHKEIHDANRHFASSH